MGINILNISLFEIKKKDLLNYFIFQQMHGQEFVILSKCLDTLCIVTGGDFDPVLIVLWHYYIISECEFAMLTFHGIAMCQC